MKARKTKNIIVALILVLGLLFAVSCQKAQAPATSEGNKPAEPSEKETVSEGEKEETKEPEKEETQQGSGAGIDAFVKEVQEKIAAHWPHMTKVWPGHEYKNHNVILHYVDEEMKTKGAWLLNAEGHKKLSEEELKDVEVPMPGGYSQLEYQGKPSIALTVDDAEMSRANAANETYRLATHELVHFYHQDGALGKSTGSRAQEFPLEIQPRLYRQMIYSHLIAAYEKPDEAKEHLGKAKYWHDKWVKEFQKEYEAVHNTDVVEGTAKYIENLGDFVTEKDDPAAFRQKAIENIVKNQKFDSADGESYELGYVAALLLDEHQPQWKETFYSEGKTLVEKLLEKVEPIEEAMDPKVEKELTEHLQAINQEVKEEMKDFLAAYEDKNVPFLKIAVPETASSYAMRDHLRYQGNDIYTGYSNSFQLAKGEINLEQTIVINEAEGEKSYIIIPLNMEHNFADGKLTVDSKQLKVNNINVVKTEVDGRINYIVQ